jgi:tetratricopeptide (TPR) repeat protein
VRLSHTLFARILCYTTLLYSFSAAVNVMAQQAEPSNSLPAIDSLWDYGHPDVTEAKLRALVLSAEKAGDLDYLLQLETQIARCQGMQGKFAECGATLDGVEKRLTDAMPVARIRYLLERGRSMNSSGHPDTAKPLFLEAWERGNAAGQIGFAIDAAHMVAIADPNLDAQVEWNLKGLALAEQDEKLRRWLPSILNNLGEAYRARQEYEKSLDCFEKRAAWFRDRGKAPDIFNLKDIARLNRLLGHADKALTIIEPIAKDLKSKGQPDGYISAEYGQCLVAVGRADEAKPYLTEAYEILKSDDYMVKYEPDELRHLNELAGNGN